MREFQQTTLAKLIFPEDIKMVSPQDDLLHAIDAVRQRDRTQASLDLLDKIVSRGDAARFLSEIINHERQACQTEDDVITNTMRNLESLAEVSESTACALMAHLWSIADDLFMHEICDAIDLWISACNSDQLTGQLMQLARSEQRIGKRHHYESLMQNRIDANGPKRSADQ